MNNIVIIAAIVKNNELGMNNKLIWHLSNDLKFFKQQTMGKYIVMGMNTFKSLPKLLPGRIHLVLTHQNIDLGEEVKVFNSYDEIIKYIYQIKEDVFIIGGEQIYRLFIDEADKLILTEIDAEEKNADAYFPQFNRNLYDVTLIDEQEDSNIKYKHLVYERK